MPETLNSFKKQKKLVFAGLLVLLGLVCYFPLFIHLTTCTFRIWDESRLAVTAYTVAHGGSWFVMLYDGKPDMWSTKPPLMIWMQAISIRLLGFNELSVRLPAAIAALLTCGALFIFCSRFIKRIDLGFISVLVLITSAGYIKEHVTRTGDYDSLLILLTTTYLLCYFIYIETENGKKGREFLLYFFLALTLAVLCKGIQGLMFLPAIFLYTLIRRKLIMVLKEKNLYVGLALFLIFGVGYYILREILNSGYIKAVWDNELGGRFGEANEGHRGPFYYYLQTLFEGDYTYWLFIVPLGIVTGFLQKDKSLKNLTLFLTIAVVQYFLIISWSETKLFWYESPLFPLMAILCGIFITGLFNLVRKQKLLSPGPGTQVLAVILTMLVFVKPYYTVVESSYNFKDPDWADWVNEIPRYLVHVMKVNENVDGYKILYNYAPTNIMTYQNMLGERKQHISFTRIDKLETGEKVIVSQDELASELKKKFNVEIIESYRTVNVYHILSKI